MKICYLADANSVHTKKWCEYFINKGHEIYVISLNEGTIKDANVYCLSAKISKKSSKIGYLKYIFKIKKIINTIGPDILHAHYGSSYGLLGALCKKKPFIISVWGSDVYEFPQKNIINSLVLRYNFKKADYIFSTSNCMADETKKYTRKNVYVTPFGVDLNKFKKLNCIKSKDKFIIGTVKTLEDKYGIDYLINGFFLFKKNNPNENVELHIAGKGTKEEQYKQLVQKLGISKEVRFLGFLTEKQVVEAFNSFDIAVFPSICNESFGVAVIEAQACGVCTVVSNAPGFSEVTINDYTSIVIPQRDSNALSNALETLYWNNEKRIALSQNGIKNVQQKYNIVNNFNYIERVYDEILKSK